VRIGNGGVLRLFFKKFTNKFTAPEASLQLKLGAYSVALGENLEGTVTVSSREDFDATEVRCEMSCVEQARVIRQYYDPQLRRTLPREVDESSVLFSARPVLSGPTHLANGETRDFQLSVNIPVTWTIKAVVAVDGRPDVVSKIQALQVVQPSAQPVIKEKEVVRQVVMIPCKYCGMLMDQLVTVCPNCGAKRTG
jgi:hypothetical protein